MRLYRRRVDYFCLNGIQIAKHVLSPRASITSSNIFFFRRRKKTFFRGPWGKCYDIWFIIDNISKTKIFYIVLNDLSILIFHTQNGSLEVYFRLAEQFRTQDEPAFCGLSTLTMVLNALAVDPKRVWKGVWRW